MEACRAAAALWAGRGSGALEQGPAGLLVGSAAPTRQHHQAGLVPPQSEAQPAAGAPPAAWASAVAWARTPAQASAPA